MTTYVTYRVDDGTEDIKEICGKCLTHSGKSGKEEKYMDKSTGAKVFLSSERVTFVGEQDSVLQTKMSLEDKTGRSIGSNSTITAPIDFI